jgi:hypothetical protein
LEYRLLDAFQATFDGTRYIHRDSSLGDFVAMHLFEDLYQIRRSKTFCARVDAHSRLLNVQNLRRGIKARRGDGTFGEAIPSVMPVVNDGYVVTRGPITTVEIGVEVKILAKVMIKQIDRVIGDLIKQVGHIRRGGENPICVGLVGVNHAAICTGYEGDRAFTTDGKKNKHPIQEAAEAELRLVAQANPSFDEFLMLHYRATNAEPYPFEWVDYEATQLDYGAILTRNRREYDRRFKNGNGA